MIIDRDKLCYLIMIVTGLSLFLLVDVICGEQLQLQQQNNTENTNFNERDSGYPEARLLFSPRIDYNEWMPVGRGDPLKNDPTYDYSPPVLDRVRYWGDTNKDKKEILLLGVPSKRQNHKKETNHNNSIRRNYYSLSHNLPTRLMPPPVQTIAPTIKQTSTESYHIPSIPYTHTSSYNHPSHSWSINSVHYEPHSEESINFISLTRPELVSNPKPSVSNYSPYYTTASRKPWIYELLQKEITKSSFSPSPPTSSLSSLSTFTPSSPSSSSSSLPSSEYFMTPSKNIFESHSVLESSADLVTPSLTTEYPEPTYFQPTIPPTPSTIDTFTTYSHKKKQHYEVNSIHEPMYLIIQGHSKVKTYGLKDTDTDNHEPKIVPIVPKEETVIKHVISKDDSGKAMEVKHLHKKPTEPIFREKIKTNLTSSSTTLSTTPTTTTTTTTKTTISTTSTTEEPSAMKSLLSLLDTSFGNFFSTNFENESNNNNKTKLFPITTTTTPTTTTTTAKGCTSPSDIENDVRERRQIFDYDQLPESSIKELLEDGFLEYDEDVKFEPQQKSGSATIDSDLSLTEAN